jgi:hypothetical protein
MIYRFLIILSIAVIVGFTSCKNNDEVFKPVVSSFFNVVNASPDTLNFYLNGTRQNNNSSLYPGSQSFYLSVPDGADNFQFKKAVIGNANVLFSVPLTLADSSNYTLYVSGETVDKSFHTLDLLDTSGIINFPNIRIRFVNASSDAGSLTALVDSANYNAQVYQGSSNFIGMGAGPKEVKIYQQSTSSPKIDTTIIFQPHHIYTLFSRSLLNGKGSVAFNVGVTINY